MSALNLNINKGDLNFMGKKFNCGLIMPISAIDGCSPEHWSEVQEIIKEALEDTDFSVKIVSDASDVGIIQKRIVQNIYDNEMVICDVSGKNPNVMFELGMRLAFNKPTIIIKDSKTNYSFDTSPIEHIEYPRDLHYASIISFKQTLKSKVNATFEASKKENYTTFLGHFGEFKVAEINSKEVSKEEFLLESINDLRDEIITLNRKINSSIVKPIASSSNSNYDRNNIDEYIYHFCMENKIYIQDLADFNGEPFLHMVESYVHESIGETLPLKPRHINAIKNKFVVAISSILKNEKHQ